MCFKFTALAVQRTSDNGQMGRTLRSKKNQFKCDEKSKFNVSESQVVSIAVNGKEYCGASFLNADNYCYILEILLGD